MTDISSSQPHHRKALNKDQLGVLYALYKFRFGTTDLLKTTQTKQITRQYMNTRLRILCEQEYIGRRYDSSYKLQAKFAQYYLLPKGIAVLKQYPDHFNAAVLRNIKRDEHASDRFVRHALNVFTVCSKLKTLYDAPESGFHFYTKSYMVGNKSKGFPRPLPDAFVIFRVTASRSTSHYIVECFDDTMPQSVMRKRIEQLVDHADNDEWNLTEKYPTILLVCETDRLRKLVTRWSAAELDRGWSGNLIIEARMLDALQFLK